jgi:HAD superfamily hydrolase (TIGR01484 family)
VIRLFVTDLDGCLSHPFRAPDWEPLLALTRLHARHAHDPHVPPLTLCTGRPLSYAAAVAQWLAVTTPILIESGSGMYDPVANRLAWSPTISARAEAALDRLRLRVHRELVARFPGTMPEFDKQRDVGVNNPDPGAIASLLEIITGMVRDLDAELGDTELEVHHTAISVNVIPRAANKGAGLHWLGEHLGIKLSEMAYIGDSGGDISALRRAGMAFAPANAIDAVKAIATATRGEATAGVLEAYQAVIAANERGDSPAPGVSTGRSAGPPDGTLSGGHPPRP